MSTTTLNTISQLDPPLSTRVRSRLNIKPDAFPRSRLRQAALVVWKAAMAVMAFALIFTLQAAFCVYVWRLPL